MAYVQPNGTLHLFKGINLDNRYLHTLYFINGTHQTTWFDNKVTQALTFSNLTYRRYTSNSVKVEKNAGDLLGVTYMRFQNVKAGGKWFYAFVLDIDYVNENTSVITYEIDVMQTWFIQVGSVKPCMVLREHVNDDTFTSNLEEEPVGSDVYDCTELYKFGQEEGSDVFGSYSIIMATTGTPQYEHWITQGLFNGSQIHARKCDNDMQAQSVANELQGMLGSWNEAQREEDIVSLYTVPSWIIDYDANDDVTYNSIPELSTPTPPSEDALKKPSTFDNYTPKNNKLFIYPYSYLLVTTHTGDTAMYRWEYFDGAETVTEFRAIGTYIGGGEIWCYPRSYNGKLNDIDDALIMNNFPKNAFNYDAYQAWIASGGSTRLENEQTTAFFKGASGILDTAGGLFGLASKTQPSVSETASQTQGVGRNGVPYTSQSQTQKQSAGGIGGGAILSAVGNVMGETGSIIEARNNLEYQFKDSKYRPNIVATKPTCNLAVATREANFYFYHCHVRADEAKRIDDFFSCYGYAINKVKEPELHSRAYWNFVMTKDCVIGGNMPASSKDAIGRIFDSGITFWNGESSALATGADIGNYAISKTDGSINNPIIASP